MNNLRFLWDLLDTNAGQIQIIIAVLCLLFAVTAVIYAIKQFQTSIDHKKFELKLQLINTLFECRNHMYEIEHQHELMKSEFLKILKTRNQNFNTIVPDFDYNYKEYFEMIINLVKPHFDLIERLITEITNSDDKITLEKYEAYMEQFITIKNNLNNTYSGYLRNIKVLNSHNEGV